MRLAPLVSVLLLLAVPQALPAAPAPRAAVAHTTSAVLPDSMLLDDVQRRTFAYFWEYGHPVSGLARERSNAGFRGRDDVVTTGGSGFGIMATIVASHRRWITRHDAVSRLLTSTAFLLKADRYHGIYPHWLNGATGRTIPFSPEDDGADLVETAYLFEGLLCARQYFDRAEPAETELRARINRLWQDADWAWHTRGGRKDLWWHWSPRHGFAMDVKIQGWNEALITYVLAASSPTHAIDAATYAHGWARDGAMRNGHAYYGIRLPLGPPYGGPLFFEHYSFMGLDPRGLVDRYADYGEQCVNHARINREYCVRNPRHFKGYGPGAWGLSASDAPDGYGAQSPTDDSGVITPSAALASFPYTPQYSMQALRHFHDDLGATLYGKYGFADAFDESRHWVAKSYIAIDEGPIVVMIENQRSGLMWRLFMSCPDVQHGLRTLGFESPWMK